MADILIKPKDVSNEQWGKATQLYNTAKSRGDRHPELTLAQAILETGWFKSPAGKYNYFGQKATASQRGSNKSTLEVSNNKSYRTNAKFRDYDTLEEAVDDRIKKWGSKYKNASTVDEALGKIWKYNPRTGSGEGYATDDKYDVKIRSILGKIGVSTNKSNPENNNYPSEIAPSRNYYTEDTETKDYYTDSTVNLTQDSGDFMTAPEYYETSESTEDQEGNLAKEELMKAQQEKNYVEELQARQQAQQFEQQQQAPQANQSGYQLYVPELPEYTPQQPPSYFKDGGIQGGIDYEAFRKSIKRYEEGGDFVDTYMETEEDPGKKTVPAKTAQPIKGGIPKFNVNEYAKKKEPILKEAPTAVAKSSITNTQKPAEKQLEFDRKLKAQKEKDIQDALSGINKDLSRKATLEDTLENKDIDLNIADYKNKDQVKKLQSYLVEKGYNLNPEGKFENNGIDGKAGKVTAKAVQQYNQNLSNSGYSSIKEGTGLLGKCTEAQCSEYSQNELFRNIQPNVSREEWNAKTGLFGDAWKIGKNITSKGGTEVDRKSVKPGDVVTMYTNGTSPFQAQADAAGTGTTHVGIVDKVNPDGSYYILHNLHKQNLSGDYEGREYRDLVKSNATVGQGFTIRHAFRPKYEAVENGEKKILRDDLVIKIDPKKASKLSSGDYNNSFTTQSAKEKLENYYIKPLNEPKNKKSLSKTFNLGDDEYNSLAKAALGILGQETGFGTSTKYTTGAKRTGAAVYEAIGLKDSEISKGAGQLKYETNFGNDDLTEIGVSRNNFNDEDKASLTTMYKLSRDYKKFLNKGFNKKDAIYRAVTNYNSSMGRVVNGKKVEDYAKDYDVDYANKVLNFSTIFDVADNKKSYKTTSDTLLLNKNVAKWKNELIKQNKI